MVRILSLDPQHGLPDIGAGNGSASTGSLTSIDIPDPATARAVTRVATEQTAELTPGIIALQEVDLGQARSSRLHQAASLAEEPSMLTHRFSAGYAGPVVGLRRRLLRTVLSSPTDDALGLLRVTVGAGSIGHGNAPLSRFPVPNWRVKRLGCRASSVEKRGKRAWDPRSYHVSTASQHVMVAATFEVPEGAGGSIQQLPIASTHLATRESMVVRQLAATWGTLAGLPEPHLLVGDYSLSTEQIDALGLGQTVGEGLTFPAADPKRHIDHVPTDLWPAGPDDLLLTDEAAMAGGDPLLHIVEWGITSFIVSNHIGTWMDLEPVGWGAPTTTLWPRSCTAQLCRCQVFSAALPSRSHCGSCV